MEAFTVTAPGVRFKDFATLSRPLFCLAIVLRVLMSSFDQGRRVTFFFLGMCAPFEDAPFTNRHQSRQETFTACHGLRPPFTLSGIFSVARINEMRSRRGFRFCRRHPN